MVHQLKIKRLLAAVCLALMPLVIVPQVSYAAGLGKLKVNSGLGEPLSAEIDVLAATSAELDTLEAKIASESVYESQGIERPSLYNAIRVEVKKKASGTVLKLSSAEAITEPFLDMLIQMDWGTGQLLREYNLLLDPPGYSKQKNIEAPTVKTAKEETLTAKPEQPAAVTAEDTPKKTKKSNKKSATKNVAEDKPQAEKPVDNPTPQVAEAVTANTEGYKTKSGDSLSMIAKNSLQDGVNLDQYMVAIFRANQDAFNRKNMNRLKVGQIVKTPNIDEAKAITPSEARKEVALHSKDWNNYKNNLAEKVAQSSGQDDGKQAENQSTGKVSTKTEDKSAQATNPRDVVKLSSGDAKGVNQSQAQLSALQDELTARDNAVKEANTRSAMLEKRIADMEKLLTLKNQGLAEAQRRATETQEPAKVVEPKPTVEPSKTTEPVKPALVEKPEATKPEETKPVETATNEPQFTAVVTPPPDQTETEAGATPSMFDGLLAEPLLLGAAAAGLALLAGAWFVVRNKRKRGLDNLEKAIQTTSGLKENTVFGNTEGASIGSGTTSFLTDFSQSGGGMIDTHDVDPIAEAEVYMAYGRDAQAEEILKDAISKDPKRYELHLKLLELYAGRKDTQAFETVAGELYSSVGAEDPLWAKAAMMGRALDPNNPMYQTGESENVPVVSQLPESPSDSEGLMDTEEIEYSVDVVASEDDLAAMDADFAAIEKESVTAEEPDDLSPELQFSLDDSLSEESHAANLELNVPNMGVFDEQQTSGDGLDFSAFKQQDLGQMLVEEVSDAGLETENLNVAGNEIDFPDFSGLEMPEDDDLVQPSANELASIASKTKDSLDAIDLNLPDVNEESETESGDTPELSLPAITQEIAPALGLPSFDLSGIDSPANQTAENNLSEETSPLVASENHPIPEVDFSKIDLDLGVTQTTSTPTDEFANLADEFGMEAESSEVETKLDLVTAYIDMGDQEGAKELLDEVLKEGGPQQRIRAQEMLKSLA